MPKTLLGRKCLPGALHQGSPLPFAKVTTSQGTLLMLLPTEIPGASTEDVPSAQVKACCVRPKPTAELLDRRSADLMQSMFPPTYLMILDAQIHISTQRSYISGLAAEHSAHNTSLGQLCILDGPPALHPVRLQAQGFLCALHSLESSQRSQTPNLPLTPPVTVLLSGYLLKRRAWCHECIRSHQLRLGVI